jgi:hypothetical protein
MSRGGSLPRNVLAKGSTAAAFACAAAMLAGCGGGSSSPDTQFGRGTASGDHAEATAEGQTNDFSKPAIHVEAAPDQRVSGTWSIACRSGMYMISHDGDTFSGRTPLTVEMRPVTSPVPATCMAVGSSTLAGSGRVTMQLLGD